MNRLLVISPRDNVATALEALSCGDTVEVQGRAVRIGEQIPRGHKVAIGDIADGTSVIKYGSAIGVASAPIAAGTHVHTHNLASVRGRGALARAAAATEARIAEPPDSDAVNLPAGEPRR
jgi:altronate hydrolase